MFIFIPKGFVTAHPDFQVKFYSRDKLIFHLIGNLLGKYSGGSESFLVIAKVFIVSKIVSRWVRYLFSSKSVGVQRAVVEPVETCA